MEHTVDKAAVDRLVQFKEYIYHCPRTGDDWIQAFVNYYSKDEHDMIKCSPCLDDCIAHYKKDKH